MKRKFRYEPTGCGFRITREKIGSDQEGCTLRETVIRECAAYVIERWIEKHTDDMEVVKISTYQLKHNLTSAHRFHIATDGVWNYYAELDSSYKSFRHEEGVFFLRKKDRTMVLMANPGLLIRIDA